MKRTVLYISLILILAVGCQKSDNSKNQNDKAKTEKKKPTKRKSLGNSSGTINSLAVIINEDLWKGEVGEGIREIFAAPVKGLPQEEPLFNLSHIPPKAFTGFTRSSRIFLKIEKGNQSQFRIEDDIYARPQTGIFVTGKTDEEIQKQLEDNSSRIIRALKQTEIKANQRRISKSLKETDILEKRFGMTMKFPSAYRYAKEEDDFVWIRKDIQHGSMEILVYEVPLQVIDKDTNVVGNIISMRDSIGERYIPGPDKGTHMITEEAYAPYLFEIELDKKFTYLTKGTWEVKGAFMAGPFVNYAIRDEKNDRYLVVEGFVFKPQAPTKRNNIFELEAIFKSIKIN